MKKLTMTPVLLLVGFISGGWSATIVVQSGDSIQVAIGVAADGDVVQVEPGTYVENLDYLGKNVTVESSGGPDVTTIDGNFSGSIVMVANGETAAVLRGFTLENGTGTEGPSGVPFGGGVLIAGATLTMENCNVRFCTASGGGGVEVTGVNAAAVIIDCEFDQNSAAFGGAIDVDAEGSLVVSGGSFTNNSSTIGGGAIYGFPDVTGSFSDCVVANNSAGIEAGGVFWDGDVTFERVQFLSNEGSFGGAIFVGTNNSGDELVVDSCTFVGNQANGPGGAILMDGHRVVTLRSTLIAQNTSSGVGAAIGTSITDTGQIVFERCTVVGNVGLSSIRLEVGGSVHFHNSIFRDNSPIEGGGSVTAEFTNIDSGTFGTGTIDADPLFVDSASADYHLTAISPCIDAGDPTSILDPDGTTADMGAFPFDQSVVILSRGDVNDDGVIHISDGIYLLSSLFLGGPELACDDAADANDSGDVTFSDAIYLFNYQLLGGAAPPAPFPNCGEDLTADALECAMTMTVCM